MKMSQQGERIMICLQPIITLTLTCVTNTIPLFDIDIDIEFADVICQTNGQ